MELRGNRVLKKGNGLFFFFFSGSLVLRPDHFALVFLPMR